MANIKPALPRHESESLRRRLREELTHARSQARRDLLPWIRSGAVEPALDHLIFYAEPAAFTPAAPDLLARLATAFGSAGPDARLHTLRFTAELALRLNSLLPAWNLCNASLYPAAALAGADVRRVAKGALTLAGSFAQDAPEARDALLAGWRAETTARFRAEAAEDPGAEGGAFVGDSIADSLPGVCPVYGPPHKRLHDRGAEESSGVHHAGGHSGKRVRVYFLGTRPA